MGMCYSIIRRCCVCSSDSEDITREQVNHSNLSDSSAQINQSFINIGRLDSVSNIHIALYDYEARDPQELTFKKGDTMIVVSKEDNGWWKIRLLHPRSRSNQGYVPYNYIAEHISYNSQPWYYGAIKRADADRLLMNPPNENGSFLVRESESKPGEYSLSVRLTDKVGHYRVYNTETDEHFIEQSAKFTLLEALINHYQNQKGGLRLKLISPCQNRETPQTFGLSRDLADKWEIDRSKLKLGKKLGSGHFGFVCKGRWNNLTDVAVKTLKKEFMKEDEFLKEAEIMTRLRHPRLVQLYGVCTKEDPLYIVTEFMCNGDLLNYIRKGAGQFFSEKALIDMGAQIASGMTYLESNNYIHRDLAARNVLVKNYNSCKVADFGLARFTSQDEIYRSSVSDLQLPIKWTAPEALGRNRFSTKSDVWSFGILLFELISKGITPYRSMTNEVVARKTECGYRMPQEDCPNCPDDLYRIMMQCWDATPESRPSFAELVNYLDEFYSDASYSDVVNH